MDSSSFQVDDVVFTSASAADRERGLLGYLSLRLNGVLELDGLTLRRSRHGRPYVGYPARIDSLGERHPYLRPVDERTRQALEEAVLHALGQRGFQ